MELELQGLKGSKTVTVKINTNLKTENKPKPGYGCFRVMTIKDGDKRLVWNKKDWAQIKEAEATFNALIEKGLVPYRVGIDGKASVEVMDVFDADAEEVIFLPVALVTGG